MKFEKKFWWVEDVLKVYHDFEMYKIQLVSISATSKRGNHNLSSKTGLC